MKVLVTGTNGFIGYYLVQSLLKNKFQVIATGRGTCRLPFTAGENFTYAEMDFTDPYSIDAVFEKYQPEIVVHAGAMGKPDECEQHQVPAYMVNVEGTVHLLVNAEVYKSFFIFISTDFVFDGETGMYSEEDGRRPVNYYGRTKMEAEDAVMDYEFDWAIVRTVMVYGKPQTGRDNILTIVKSKLEKGEEYSVFDDQVRTPTYVEDLTDAIVKMIELKATGIYHISGEEILTPYQMAIQAAAFLKMKSSLIKQVTASTFSQPARRPLITGFKIDKAKQQLGYQPHSFKEGLEKTYT